MALSSMTGFARSHGVSGAYAWAWELKSVNSKGLDVRLRLPPGWDAIDAPVRGLVAGALARGTVHANLTIAREGMAPSVQVNEQVLDALLSTITRLGQRIDAAPPSIDGILALKGVVEVVDQAETEEERRTAEAATIDGFKQALASLGEMRRTEGKTLVRVLTQRLAEIATLTEQAEAVPGRRPDAIKARLAEQVATLLAASERFDPDRLHQEAILLATKADIREELDRLASHVEQARKLMSEDGAVGRRLDFLSQELNREANTLCAKSNDVELTRIGLELKSIVEQFREQVQNLE
jgi:uncharacterized protein (TIGR00255 family)